MVSSVGVSSTACLIFSLEGFMYHEYKPSDPSTQVFVNIVS